MPEHDEFLDALFGMDYIAEYAEFYGIPFDAAAIELLEEKMREEGLIGK